MKHLLSMAMVLCSFNVLAQANEDLLGSVGESCRARADCRSGLKCLANVCQMDNVGAACGATTDCGGGGLRCIDRQCRLPSGASAPVGLAPPPPMPMPVAQYPQYPAMPVQAMQQQPVYAPAYSGGAGSAPSLSARVEPSVDLDDELEGRHPYVGLAGGAGLLTAEVPYGYGSKQTNGFITTPASVVVGIWLGQLDLNLAGRPGSNFFLTKLGTVAVWGEVTGNVGYLASLYRSGSLVVGWMFRFGMGVVIGDMLTQFVARAQVIGLVVRKSHFDFEFGVPASVGGGTILMLSVVPTLSVSYRF